MEDASPRARVARLLDLLQQLQAQLSGLEKYANTPDASSQLQASLRCNNCLTQLVQTIAGPVEDHRRIMRYFVAGAKLDGVLKAQKDLIQSLATLMLGSVPMPRTTKDTLSTLRARLLEWQPGKEEEKERQAADTLESLYDDIMSKAKSVEAVEVAVDAVMQDVLLTCFNTTKLGNEELMQESSALELAIQENSELGILLSLALNSLQRIHASQLHTELSHGSEDTSGNGVTAEEEEEEEEDDDDMFFMPMPSAALKMADAKKFATLAAPLTRHDGTTALPGQPAPIFELIDDDPVSIGAGPGSSQSSDAATVQHTTSTGAPGSGAAPPKLTSCDFTPLTSTDVSAATSGLIPVGENNDGATSLLDAAPMAGDGKRLPAAQQPAGTSDQPDAERMSRLEVNPRDDTAHDATDAVPAKQQQQEKEEAQQQQDRGSSNTAPDQSPVRPLQLQTSLSTNRSSRVSKSGATEDKHHKFVEFLQGQNPQACMFHAQMKLSLEGCRKLANFLASSNRVRALSLSHNCLGDDGMAIIAQGLRVNSSVTSIDLPDNNISDNAAAMLAESVMHNTSLTQLQLANNNIGDAGATALAELIKANHSIKKLGLSYNKIGREGCRALTAAISSNKTLQQLQLLPGNPVEEKDAKALAKALTSVKKFSIRSLLGL